MYSFEYPGVNADGEPPVTVSSKTTRSTSTTSSIRSTLSSFASSSSIMTTLTSSKTSSPPPSTTSSAGNGITTPTPRQPVMIENCKYFYWVKPGETCDSIATAVDQWVVHLTFWNDCNNLWANAWACVGVDGYVPTTTRMPTPSPTKSPNGITTPTPHHPSMVDNCKYFYWVKPGDSCDSIATSVDIWVVLLTFWNDCNDLWANSWACVGIEGQGPTTTRAPTPSPTKPPNGITTPTPRQPVMVDNCNSFYWVKQGDTCDSISRETGVWIVFLTFWNDCNNLWANYWGCIGVTS